MLDKADGLNRRQETMELTWWKKLFVWLVFLPGFLATVVYLVYVAWPAIALGALLVLLVSYRKPPRRSYAT